MAVLKKTFKLAQLIDVVEGCLRSHPQSR